MINLEKYIISFPTGYTQPVLRVDIRSYGAEGHGSAFIDERGLDDAYDRASRVADIHQKGITDRENMSKIAHQRQRDLSLLGIDWTWDGSVL